MSFTYEPGAAPVQQQMSDTGRKKKKPERGPDQVVMESPGGDEPAPEVIGSGLKAPAQVDMIDDGGGGVDVEKKADVLDRGDTCPLEEQTIFREARCCCLPVDKCWSAVCDCWCYREYRITNKGMKVFDKGCCSENTNNIDWTSFESIDHSKDCCFGYVDVSSRDAAMGDFSLRVQHSQLQLIFQELLNLSAGDVRDRECIVWRDFGEQPTPCAPCACWLTSYQITNHGLRVQKNRDCCGLMGYKVNNLRWLSQAGTDSILDIDSETDCCWGYVNLCTQDPDPKMEFVTMRLKKDETEDIVQELRRLNAGANSKGDKSFETFLEVGCCWGFCDPCIPRCLRAFDTRYIITQRGISIKKWTPCWSSSTHVAWSNVLDLDRAETCCLGILDVQVFQDKQPHNLKLRLRKKRAVELYDVIKNLRRGLDANAEDPIVNHFREAEWCFLCAYLRDLLGFPTRYFLRKAGLEIRKTHCTGCGCGTSVDHAKWDVVRDVDYSEDCCFGYVNLETFDQELGNTRWRVTKSQAEVISRQILNLKRGGDPNAPREALLAANRPGCLLSVCPCCCQEQYIITDEEFKVKRRRWCTVTQDNISWEQVRDVDGSDGCCFSFLEVATSNVVRKDEDRSGDHKPGEDDWTREKTLMTVWHSKFEALYRALRARSSGKKHDHEDKPWLTVIPRGWCDCLTCYKGFCWFYHPVQYWASDTGFQQKNLYPCSRYGCCLSKFNYVSWASLREVNEEQGCCWGYVDVHTQDEKLPHIRIRVWKDESQDIASQLRHHRARE